MKNWLASLLLVLTACNSTSPDTVVKALKSIESWTATAQMVGESWQQDKISAIYARQTIEKSQQEIAKETKSISVPPAIAKSLEQVQQTLGEMNAEVKQKQKSKITVFVRQLAEESQQIDAFIKIQEKQP